jgi:hypothetical protein
MALATDQVELRRNGRTLLMGPGTEYTVLPGFDPWSRTTRAPQTMSRPYAHGSLVGSEWVDDATVLIPLSINRLGGTKASWMSAHQQLAAAFTAVGDSGEMAELRFEWGGAEYYMLGRPVMPRVNTDNIAVGKAVEQVAFIAADPRIYSSDASVLSTDLPLQQGGLTIPVTTASTRLRLPDVSGSYASTPNHASLQITGDFSLRIGLDLRSWTDGFQQLLTRYGAAGAVSYALNVDGSGIPRVQWSADGTNVLTAPASQSLAGVSRMLWLRGDLDVDNGAAGRTVTFYTGPTKSGPWTAFGSPVVQAGVTSVFAGPSGSALEIGSRGGGTTQLARGAVYGAQVLNSAGTIVANPDFTTQMAGATSFADSTGKTWTVNGTAQLVPDTVRGGRVFPSTIPGVLNGGSLDLVNNGTANAGMTVRIDGPASEPRLILRRPDGTVQSVRFLIDLADGQWLEIDSTSNLALLNGLASSNQRGNAIWDLDAYPLQPGVNTLRFLSGVYDTSSLLTATYRSAWW